jgi:hypothetical protein
LQDNIKRGLKEMGWDGFAWIHLVKDRDNKRSLVNRNGSLGLIKSQAFFELWRSYQFHNRYVAPWS